MKAVAALVDRVCDGEVPQALRDCRLFPVPKADGGVRPVGAGEVLRKVAARLALEAMEPTLRKRCESEDQLGMSKDGADGGEEGGEGVEIRETYCGH